MLSDSIRIHLAQCVYYEGGAEWNYSNVRYPYNTFYFVLGGNGSITAAGETIPMREGSLYLIPAGTLFSCRCECFVSKVYADVHVELVPGYDIFSGLQRIYVAPWEAEETQALREACGKDTLSSELFIRGVITKAVAAFAIKGQFSLNQELLPFRGMLDDIEQNLSSQLKIQAIAEKYGWEPAALSKKFKKAFHCSMKQYIELLLLNRLKSALILSDRTVKELAADFGFCDQYYLCSFFKKHESVSPTQYRRENRRQYSTS